ncbi:MAG: HEAT repeat domain-containing protein [Pseudomonadota bacterium]|nr:HEAT repeat domain-containing protein [Pseudomonadota bacterium]
MTDNETALNALTRLIDEGDEADRCHCVRVLGNLGDPAGIPALVKCLRDDDIDVCVDAAEALGRIGSEDVVPILIESLSKDPNGEVARAVAESLGRIGGPRAIEALVAVASERPEHLQWDDGWDDWWDMQLAAVEALGRHKAQSALPALQAILEAEDAKDIEEQVLHALARIGGKGVDLIVNRLHYGSIQGRRRAARALGDSGSDMAARVLGRALQDGEPEVRIAAVESLAQLRADRYLSAVLLLLRDPDDSVRAAAANAAMELARDAGTDLLRAQLLPVLDDPSPAVVRAALGALQSCQGTGQISPEIAEKALALLTHEDEEIAALAAVLASHSDTAEASEGLLEVLRNRERPAQVRRQAAMALGRRSRADADVLDALTLAVLDPEQPVRLGALTALMALEGAGEGEREPRDLVLDALAGRLQVPDAADGHPDAEPPQPVEQVIEFQPDALKEFRGEAAPRGPESSTDNGGGVAGNVSTEGEVPLPDAPEGDLGLPPQRSAQSTLDAISIDNVEAALLLGEDQDEATAVDRFDPAVQSFFDVLDENERMAEKLFPSRTLSVELDVRRLSARILAGSDSPPAIDALLHALVDDDAEVRTAAAFSLEAIAARIPDNPALLNATGALVAQLSIGEEGQRTACARALAHLKNRAALGPLLDALEQDSSDLRIAAAGALAELTLSGADPEDAGHMVPVEAPQETVVQALTERLSDPEPGVRVAAADALARLSRAVALNSSQPRAVQHLIDAAYAGEGQQARAMGRALRAFGADAAEQPLLSRLATCTDSGERRFAVEMLDELLRPDGAQPA